ncbi:MAG: response regulator transcription factor [Planctomycetaceae bacterium]|nr:response regulator transcription factor [Planctomycetaceae bacterium]MBT4723636.1 response regulator transcription factor [Planctomycetaceae bacterium]MBT4845502.1 response regulator transcription factor [Planctomycetaceae bacterium]MBT5125329.1 response regulator transcription factor [Planctomycetaceae bacterium]MBT5598909.1 response regulator transcription factor [Planctomycetaceae bacterium]
MMIRLMVIDDHEIVRSGMVRMIRGTEIQLIAESNSGENILEGIVQFQPDVILLDVRMENGDGLTALGRAKIEYPKIPVLMLSTFDNPTYIARAVALGASGYLLKSLDREQIVDAIMVAYRGGNSWTREALRRVAGALATPRISADVDVPLTHRESEVLEQLAEGLTNKEIAFALGISYETVKEHVQHILRKIGVNDRTQAAVWAVRQGVV